MKTAADRRRPQGFTVEALISTHSLEVPFSDF